MPRPSARRAVINKERVVQAAADLLNAEGAEALTINRLAQQLGIQPPSLYNHIAGLDDLWRQLALLNVRLLGDCLAEAAMGRSGRPGVLAVAGAYRAYVKAYPGLYQASLRASGKQDRPFPELEAAEERVVRIGLAVVASFGLEGEDAVHAMRGLRSAVHGFASLEIAGGFGLPLDLDESFRRLIEMMIRGFII